jgi:energy-coupling factor transporter transmembrane protein EcfT
MIGLVVRFIPLVLDEAEETALAQKARCVENRRNPVSRLLSLGMSLMRRVFGRADDVTMALQARCYTEDPDTSLENRTCLRIDWKDWIRFAAVAVVCIGLVVSGI